LKKAVISVTYISFSQQCNISPYCN